MSSDQVTDKDQLARLGEAVSSLPLAPSPPALHSAGHFAAFGLGTLGVLNAGSPGDYSLKLFLVWVLPCLLLAIFGGVKLYREIVATNWTPTLHERGIALRRFGKLKAIGFNEVRQISIRRRDVFDRQELYARQRDVTLRTDSEKLVFRLRTLDGQPDEPGAFLEELRTALAEIAERRLRKGKVIEGNGWRLSGDAFKAGSLEVPFDQVAGADLFGGDRVGLWKLGEERPFFTIPASSPNVMLVLDVLASRLPTHALGLGRVQFEKRPHWLPAGLAGLIAVFSFYSAYQLMSLDAGVSPTALFQAGAGFLSALGAYALAAAGVRCYERGLVKYSVLGRREIQFAEVGGLTYRASLRAFKGIHLFTSLTLILFRRPEGRPFRIDLQTRRKGDRDLEGLRDHLADRLANEAYERLEQEGEIRWIDDVWLTPQGVRYADKFLHFTQGVLYSFEESDFYLYRKGGGKPVARMPADAPNFFAGFLLMDRLAAEAQGSVEAREGS
ncbi:MAG TPA: hypothetical protein VF789_26840 [Thermoanaerobaculia bacterium]